MSEWTVELKAFSFYTEEEARAFQEALINAFEAMPENEGVSAISRFYKEDEE